MRISDWSSDVCSSDLEPKVEIRLWDPILEAIGSLFLFLWAVQHEGSRALRAIEELEAQIRHIDDSASLGLLQQHPPSGLAVGVVQYTNGRQKESNQAGRLHSFKCFRHYAPRDAFRLSENRRLG